MDNIVTDRPTDSGAAYGEALCVPADLAREQRFFAMSLDLMCTANLATGCFERLSPSWSRILGYSLDELLTRPFIEFVHSDDHAATLGAAATLSNGNDVVSFVNRYRHKSGSYLWFEWMAAAVPAEQTIYAIARDVTERKRTEEELRLSQEQKSQLIVQLQQQNQRLHQQAEALRELATPILPLSPGIVAMPLVGEIDPQRAQQIMETLLSGVASGSARVAILDITGVRQVDSHGADALIRAAQAIRLLGATAVLTGIQPRIAQTLVGMGVNLSGLVTRSTLQDGIAYAFQIAAPARQAG